MPSKLPERASLEYLKKLARDHLQELRRADPQAKLATALLEVARDHGFSSWRALKAEIEERQTRNTNLFFDACEKGHVDALRSLLANDPNLARAMAGPHYLRTGLHAAAQGGHSDAVHLLLQHGADPNARETGDNTTPLHWAAAGRHLETVRALLDAGADVHGLGDVHQLDAIGWASFFHPPGGAPGDSPGAVSLLIERGAHHHIFSAMAMGDLNLIRVLVEHNPAALDRRMSRFEQGQTPLHFAITLHRYDILELLIELGADLEAEDHNGQTAMAVAMLRGDHEAMRRLQAAGAALPAPVGSSSVRAGMARMADSIKKGVPMIGVADVAATLDWYASIGFQELARYGEEDQVNFGMVSFGKAELMLSFEKEARHRDVSLWLYTGRVDDLYQLLKSRQMAAVQAALAGQPDDHDGVEFVEDINDTFYGARQFGIRDPNGYILYFIQHTGS